MKRYYWSTLSVWDRLAFYFWALIRRSKVEYVDPVCLFHGKRWSEHPEGRCVYCCICFETNPKDGWAVDSVGQKWDVCNTPSCRAQAGVL